MTETNTKCPQCGASLDTRRTGGLCPACLLLGAADEVPGGGTLGSIGGHELIGIIARGGMGVVYRARQSEPAREVALKALPGTALLSDEARQRFRVEAQAMAALEHPHILPIHEFGEVDGTDFFTMKMAAGGTLADRMVDYAGRWREIAGLMATVAEAVQFAHERGVLHRDLKPGNILFDEKGEAYVSDFGLAKLAGDEATLTRTAAMMGTPSYLAPEAAMGMKGAATTSSDVWSLGVMLHELLRQGPAFQAESIPALLRQIVEAAPAPLGKSVPADLRVIALKALAKEPARRYASARDLAADLRRWLEGRPIEARTTGTIERAWLWARRYPAFSGVAVLAALSLVGAMLSLSWGFRSARREVAQVSAARESERQQLRQALLEKSRAGRIARWSGWRDSGTAALRQAASISPGMDVQTEVIAHLAGIDLVPGTERGLSYQLQQGQEASFEKTWAFFASAGSFSTLPSLSSGRPWLDPQSRWLMRREILPSGMFGPNLELCDPRSGKVRVRWPGYQPVGFAEGGDLLAVKTAAKDEVKILNSMTLEQVGSISLNTSTKSVIAFSRDHPALVGILKPTAGTSMCGLEVWNWRTNTLLTQFEERHEERYDVSDLTSVMSWQGERIAASFGNGTVSMRDLRHRTSYKLRLQHKTLSHLSFSPDGVLFSTGSPGETSGLWETVSGQLVVRSPHFEPVAMGAGGIILDGMTEENSRWGRLQLPTAVRLIPLEPLLHKSDTSKVDFSPDGRWLAIKCQRGAGIFEVENGKMVYWKAPPQFMRAFTFTPDGRQLIVGDTQRLWLEDLAVEAGRVVMRSKRDITPPGTNTIDVLTISDDCRWLVCSTNVQKPSSAAPRALRTLDLNDIEAGWQELVGGSISDHPLSPGGRWIVRAPETPFLYDRNSPDKPARKIDFRASGVSFSPDARLIAVMGAAGLKIFDVITLACVHTESLENLATGNNLRTNNRLHWSPDGTMLAIAMPNHGVLALATKDWRRIAVLNGPFDLPVDLVRFSPDGRTLALLRPTGAMELWDLDVLQKQLAGLGLPLELPPPGQPAPTPPGLEGPLKPAELPPLFNE